MIKWKSKWVYLPDEEIRKQHNNMKNMNICCFRDCRDSTAGKVYTLLACVQSPASLLVSQDRILGTEPGVSTEHCQCGPKTNKQTKKKPERYVLISSKKEIVILISNLHLLTGSKLYSFNVLGKKVCKFQHGKFTKRKALKTYWSYWYGTKERDQVVEHLPSMCENGVECPAPHSVSPIRTSRPPNTPRSSYIF